MTAPATLAALERTGVPSWTAVRRRLPWRSSSARFALLYVLLSLVCTVPILLYVYRAVDAILLEDFTRPLEFRLSNLEKQYRVGGLTQLQAAVASRSERVHRDQTAILLTDSDGRILAGNLLSWPTGIDTPRGWSPASLHREDMVRPEQFLIRTIRLPGGHRLLLGGLLDNRAEMQAALLLALAAAFVLAVPVGLLGGFALVREINRMIATITGIGEQVAAGDLKRRAETDGSGDPVDRLKTTLNATLDRIEALVEEHRVLTDTLAHDLRSPLSRIHMLVVGGARAEPAGEQAARFPVIAQELDGVLHILDSALEISRATAGIGRGGFQPVDVGAMLCDLCELYQPLAVSCEVRMVLQSGPGSFVQGNHALLARAMSNLIDNALKYGGAGGEITLSLHRRAGMVSLIVADRAEGIPAHRRDEALRKFGRLDPARTTPGSGLGLSLVAAVSSLHGGTFALDDNNPGLRAVLTLPSSA